LIFFENLKENVFIPACLFLGYRNWLCSWYDRDASYTWYSFRGDAILSKNQHHGIMHLKSYVQKVLYHTCISFVAS